MTTGELGFDEVQLHIRMFAFHRLGLGGRNSSWRPVLDLEGSGYLVSEGEVICLAERIFVDRGVNPARYRHTPIPLDLVPSREDSTTSHVNRAGPTL